MRSSCLAAIVALSLLAPAARATPSSEELVRQARAHEAAREHDVAVRRYMEALELDVTTEDAWLGLGALRLRLGEPAEAMRVYDAALVRLPTLHAALAGRAHALRALGRRAEAESALEAYAALEGSVDALRELGAWYGVDGRAPAQLSVWRRILRMAVDTNDEPLEREARRMVRALVILVDGADPAASPAATDATRRGLAAIARRGG